MANHHGFIVSVVMQVFQSPMATDPSSALASVLKAPPEGNVICVHLACRSSEDNLSARHIVHNFTTKGRGKDAPRGHHRNACVNMR